jgi:hypothetical protein
MSPYADIPKPVRAGLVIVDPQRGPPQQIIVLHFNRMTAATGRRLGCAGRVIQLDLVETHGPGVFGLRPDSGDGPVVYGHDLDAPMWTVLWRARPVVI